MVAVSRCSNHQYGPPRDHMVFAGTRASARDERFLAYRYDAGNLPTIPHRRRRTALDAVASSQFRCSDGRREFIEARPGIPRPSGTGLGANASAASCCSKIIGQTIRNVASSLRLRRELRYSNRALMDLLPSRAILTDKDCPRPPRLGNRRFPMTTVLASISTSTGA